MLSSTISGDFNFCQQIKVKFNYQFRFSENVRNVVRRKLELWPFPPAELFLRCIEYAAAVDGNLGELGIAGAGTEPLKYIEAH